MDGQEAYNVASIQTEVTFMKTPFALREDIAVLTFGGGGGRPFDGLAEARHLAGRLAAVRRLGSLTT